MAAGRLAPDMYPEHPHNQQSGFDLREYLFVLRRRWLTVVLVMGVVVALGVFSSYRKTAVYESTANILLQSDAVVGVFGQQSSGDPERRVQNEAELITSADTIREVEERLGFGASVSATAGGDTDVIEITATSASASRAALIANTYAEAHRDLRQAESLTGLQQAEAELQQKVAEIDTALAANAQQLADLNSQRNDAIAQGNAAAVTDIDKAITENQQGRQGIQNERQGYADRIGQLQVQENLAANVPPLEILSRAAVPGAPISPDHRQDTTIALVIGLLLGVGAAFLREHLDDSVHGPSDLDAATGGLPHLAMIPTYEGAVEDGQQVIVTSTQPMSHAAEAYRSLRTSVEFLGIDRPLETLQVASAQANEGKTATLVNLAVAFAQAGETVVIVDCDLRRPSIHEYFGLDRSIGFTSVLLGECDLEDAIRPAPGFHNLKVVCAGPLTPNPSELLRSARFAELIKLLTADQHLVLIDSPPVLPVTDSLVISRVADATLLIASSGISSKRRVKRATAALRQVDAPVVGTLLNRAPATLAYSYVDYGYVYYGPHKDKKRPRLRPWRKQPMTDREHIPS